MLAVTVLALCLGAVFAIYDLGSRAFLDSGSGGEARNDAALVLDRVGKAVNRACWEGASAQTEVLSLPSPCKQEGQLAFSPSGQALWQGYEIFYRDGTTDELRHSQRALSTALLTIYPIDSHDFGSGVRPLGFYATEGRVLARGVTRFEAEIPSRNVVTLQLKVERAQRQGRPPALCEMRSQVAFRN